MVTLNGVCFYVPPAEGCLPRPSPTSLISHISLLKFSEHLHFFFLNPHPRTFFHCSSEREEGRETSVQELPPKRAGTGDQMHNLGRCPDQELNTQPLGYRTVLQPTEPHQPGHVCTFSLQNLLEPKCRAWPRVRYALAQP